LLEVRSEFDQLLLNHARASGAAVYEQTRVDAVHFDPSDPERPVSVSWTHTPPQGLPSPPASPTTSTFARILRRFSSTEESVHTSGGAVQGTTAFTHVIDASGRAGLMSTRYLHNRRFNASLKNIAVWGYWKEVESYGQGTQRSGAPWFEALTGKSPVNICYFFYSYILFRRVGLGLVHSPSQWLHLGWHCRQPKGLQRHSRFHRCSTRPLSC